MRLARAALPAEHEIADHGNVVVPANRFAAAPAARARKRDRFAARHPVNADVQKAADAQAEQEQKNEIHRGVPGNSGNGPSADFGCRRTRPLAGKYTYGAPEGSVGNPRSKPAAWK